MVTDWSGHYGTALANSPTIGDSYALGRVRVCRVNKELGNEVKGDRSLDSNEVARIDWELG